MFSFCVYVINSPPPLLFYRMPAPVLCLCRSLVAAGMEEDGSFIGKYNPRRDEKSSLGATLV